MIDPIQNNISRFVKYNKWCNVEDLSESVSFDVILPKTNIAPENRPSQKETILPTIHFQGLC